MTRYLIAVPGYGVPESGYPDDNTKRYIGGIIEHLTKRIALRSPRNSVHIAFLGGATNPESRVTEAAILEQAWRERPRELRDLTWRIETSAHARGLSFWENLLTLRALVHCHSATHVIVYCEYHRFRRCEYLAQACFSRTPQHVVVVPIDFDKRVYTLRDYLMRWVEYRAAVMSMNVPGFHALERWLRMRKIGR